MFLSNKIVVFIYKQFLFDGNIAIKPFYSTGLLVTFGFLMFLVGVERD